MGRKGTAADAACAPRVAVVGASGYIGTHLVPLLAERGLRVRAVARSHEVLAARGWPDVELAAADVLEPETLDAALEDIDVAYYLVHCMRAGESFEAIESEGAKNFARSAARSGLKRIVYLGGLIPPGADSRHLLSRGLTGDLLRAGPVPVTELRAGIVVGPGCASFEIIRDLVNHLPVMITPRWVRSKSPPIALANVLEYLIGVAFIPQAAGKTYDVAGPELLTYEQLLRQYAEHVGKRPLILAVPALSPRLSSYWLWLITAVPTSTARALIEGLKLNFAPDDSAIRALVPQRLLTYREAVAAVFDTERRNAVAARWTEGALMYRDYNPDYAFYAKRDTASSVAAAPLEAVWRQITSIGGDNRYFVASWLWTIRETVDWALGGPGRNRGRRHPGEVRVGDTIDHWRVIGVEAPRRLSLAFGMKAPGAAVLEFEATPLDDTHTRVTVTAHWHPAGVWGIVYWHAFSPSHYYIFNGMARAIARRAEAARDPGPARTPSGEAAGR
jgi:uncharacterized protein YbjT (DUF2867 family)/uncharacterized protein YndB with AHSA1/START domain